jgi:iron complex outermembrane receptor protein
MLPQGGMMKGKQRSAAAVGWAVAGLISCLNPATPAVAQSIEELRDMPITALANLDVLSATKSASTLGDAPTAIYVITHDDIVRSGTLTLPGILRLAPNLHVMRGSGNTVISARGLSGNPDAQNFSNKLLVLIDGRSVYTPLFSGVYWDMQDVLPEDVERIEVISGPGATLWGANAMNGVINIITRNAGATQGGYGTGVLGERTYDAGLRYGGRISDTANYRLFAKVNQVFETARNADNGSIRLLGGFRVDWNPTAADQLMLEGNLLYGLRGRGLSPDERLQGQNIVTRWNHESASGSKLQVQAYYDHNGRDERSRDGARFTIHTFDLDVQHSFALGSVHQIVWGGGARISRYDIDGTSSLDFVPDKRTLFLANIFVQDSIALTPSLTGIVGLKYEHDPYSGGVLLPNARLAWKPNGSTLLWAAISRAIRSPTPFDRDVVERLGSTVFLTGSSSFRSEKLTAYEAGTRITLSSSASVSVSGFYNEYDDLRSIELTPQTLLPLVWGNGIRGHSYGLEAWADYRLTAWWRIKPGYSLLLQNFHFKPGASGLLGTSQVGNDPKHRASVRSSMDIGREINLDADLRYVSPMRSPYAPSYIQLGARLGWQFTDRAELSVAGFNLLHKHHQELPASQASPVSRSVFLALKWHL